MSKREGDSPEKEEPERQKCDITEDEAIPDIEDDVVLPQLHVRENSSPLDYMYESGRSSSASSTSSSDSVESLSLPSTREDFLNFTRFVPTSKWNSKENAKLVFEHLRVRSYIVHPERFLSKFYEDDREKNRISNILAALEKEKNNYFGVPWSKLKKSVEELLVIYECEGLEELAHIHADDKQEDRACDLLTAFKEKIEMLTRKDESAVSIFWKLNKIMQEISPGRTREYLFEEYIRNLISFMDGKLSIFLSATELDLLFPECKEFKQKIRGVKPDFLLSGKYGDRIALVGEVVNLPQIKTAGSHGPRFESHQGRKLKGAHESSDKRDSEIVELVASTSIADTSDETHPGTEADTSDETYPGTEAEPDHADAVTGNKEEKDGKKKDEKDGKRKLATSRNLDKKEKYKVSCYLPQLLAQMMAAMQVNPIKTMKPTHSNIENYQLGFAVEGWKLRFVKLVVRDYLGQFNESGQHALVNELLQGKPLKCDVYLTQEFNLLKKEHVKSFFKMLVAIGYHNCCYL